MALMAEAPTIVLIEPGLSGEGFAVSVQPPHSHLRLECSFADAMTARRCAREIADMNGLMLLDRVEKERA